MPGLLIISHRPKIKHLETMEEMLHPGLKTHGGTTNICQINESKSWMMGRKI